MIALNSVLIRRASLQMPFATHASATNNWALFTDANDILVARAVEEVLAVVHAAQAHADRGGYAAGFLAYESAPAFDPAFRVHPSVEGLPLAWFGLFEEPRLHPGPQPPRSDSAAAAGIPWTLHISPAAYHVQTSVIRSLIEAGDTYQVNYTMPADGTGRVDPWELFEQLCWPSPEPEAALLRTRHFAVVSASPELLFCQQGNRVTTRPMKGTAPRGRWPAEDADAAERLARSEKDRAENVMIVDLLRNDLGRIARPGSVCASPLFEVTPHRGVWQMTSTVAAETDASPADVLGALFPCGSVTGAPKVRTMSIIQRLEGSPRGVYCGALGWFGPGCTARFAVPIRTALVETTTGRATYNVGSGITWDSNPRAEYEECRAKLVPVERRFPRFELLETMSWHSGRGFDAMQAHLQRLAVSAETFGWRVDLKALEAALLAAAGEWPADGPAQRVRLTVDHRGCASVSAAPLEAWRAPRRLGLAASPVDATSPLLYHKTTYRAVYERALQGLPPGVDDVILWNRDGHVTETSICNLAVEDGDGNWWTPPVACGLLPGTLRAELIRSGSMKERIIPVEELGSFRNVRVFNSVRGVLDAVIV